MIRIPISSFVFSENSPPERTGLQFWKFPSSLTIVARRNSRFHNVPHKLFDRIRQLEGEDVSVIPSDDTVFEHRALHRHNDGGWKTNNLSPNSISQPHFSVVGNATPSLLCTPCISFRHNSSATTTAATICSRINNKPSCRFVVVVSVSGAYLASAAAAAGL